METIPAADARDIRPLRAAATLAALAGLVALAVVTAWLTGRTPVVQVLPFNASMPFTTALALVALSAAVVGPLAGYPRLVWAAGPSGVLAGLSLLHYLAGLPFFSDRLPATLLEEVTAGAGGTWALTAAALLAASAAAWGVAHPAGARIPAGVWAAAAGVPIALGAASFFEHAVGSPSSRLWHELAGVTVHTAVCLILIGLALLVRAWALDSELTVPRWGPAYAAVAVVFGSLLLSEAVRQEGHDHTVARAQQTALSFQTSIELELAARTEAVRRMAARLRAGVYKQDTDWRVDAANYLADVRDPYASMTVVDEVAQEEWRWPVQSAGASRTAVSESPTFRRLLDQARLQRDVVMSQHFKVAPGIDGFVLVAPIVGSLDVKGFLVLELAYEPLLDRVLNRSPHAISVLEGELPLYNHGVPPDDAVSVNSALYLPGSVWQLRLFMPASAGWARSLPTIVLAGGLLLALSVGAALRLARGNVVRAGHLRESNQQLRTTEELLHSVLDASTNGIIAARAMRSPSGAITDFEMQLVNPAAERLLGKSADQLIGRRLREQSAEGDPDGHLIDTYVSVIETGTSVEIERQYSGDGLDGWFRLVATPLADGISLTFEDVTQRKRAEADRNAYVAELERSRDQIHRQSVQLQWQADELTRARDEALAGTREMETALRMQADFVSFASHQLRTPLAGIKWLMELAREEPGADGELRSYLDDSLSSAERLIGLVNDLLDVARLEAGRTIAAPVCVDLSGLCRDLVHQLQPNFDQRRHTIALDGLDHETVVFVDGAMVQQAVQNLLSNAIKYTPDGGHVRLTVGQADGTATVTVEDSGIGVPEEARPWLFEKFFRADNVHTIETEGTGLGLFMVRLILEKFGGRIWYEPRPDAPGSRFLFTLPLHEERDDSGEANPDRRRRPRAA